MDNHIINYIYIYIYIYIIAYLEEILYEIISKKYNNDIKEEFTKSRERYLDDCFMPMGRHKRITQPTTKPTLSNKIYHGT